jgi:DNA-binding transcriptional MerR regulator
MLTLFGEELIPEQVRGVPKSARTQQPEEPASEPVKDGTAGILSGWVSEKQYYPIGEVAALFQVRSSHVRFWTNEFQIHVRTTQKGDRLYTADNIQQLRLIYHLVRERGFTIPGAKAVMAQQKKPQPNTLDLRDALLRLRNQLQTLRNGL